MVEDSLATQATLVGFPVKPGILFAYFLIFRSCKDDEVHSKPATPMPKFLRNELFDAITLKWEMALPCREFSQAGDDDDAVYDIKL